MRPTRSFVFGLAGDFHTPQAARAAALARCEAQAPKNMSECVLIGLAIVPDEQTEEPHPGLSSNLVEDLEAAQAAGGPPEGIASFIAISAATPVWSIVEGRAVVGLALANCNGFGARRHVGDLAAEPDCILVIGE